MKHFPLSGTLPLLALVSMTACVDDNYDLDNIDTTTEIKVKDLVLPINLDAVKLGDIISIKEGSELNEVTVNGQSFYAVDKDGEFRSDPIHIPSFSADAPSVASSQLRFVVPAVSGATGEITIPIVDPVESSLAYQTEKVDDAIIELSAIQCDPINISVTFVSSVALDNASLQNIEVSLPKGLHVTATNPADASYDSSTGLITVPEVQFVRKGGNYVAEISLTAEGITDMTAYGYGIQPDRTLSIASRLSVDKADLKLADLGSISSDVTLGIDYSFSRINVKSVSGTINYKLDGIGIDPVSINDIPDFLAQEGTNLVLANPQIYLELNNPVYPYNLSYSSGIEINRVYENGAAGTPLTLDDGIFTVEPTEFALDFCFSPFDPVNKPENFKNAAHVPFTSLSDVIAGDGNGIPTQLMINLVDPQIPAQSVADFRLGTDLSPVVGKWQLLAPLALKAGSGSKIIYTDRKTGWNDKDVDAITITHLSLSMVADSNLPLNAILSGYPIDTDGNPISGVTIKPVEIKGMTADQEITLVVEGTVRHLDGFEFTATVGADSSEALSPDQTLILKNIRAKVSGSYTTDF